MSSEFNDINKTAAKRSFLEKLSINSNDWISCIFYSICLVIFVLLNQHFYLTSFNERVVSRATIENFDIPSRINLYYFLLFLFPFLCILFKLLANRIGEVILLEERNLINYISLGGLLLLLFGVFTVELLNIPIYLVFVAHGILFIKILFRNIKKEKAFQHPALEYDVFIFSLLFSIIVFLLFKRISLIFNYASFSNFYIFILVTGILIYCFLWNYLIKFNESDLGELKFSNLLRLFKPFSLIPVAIAVTTETYLFLNIKSIFYINQSTIFLILISLLFLWFLVKTYFKKKEPGDYKKLLFNYHIPMFILGMTLLLFYNPILIQIPDLYEGANPSFAVQQFFDFHKIPFIDSFGSHELSEILFPFLYTSLYGFSDISFLLFDFTHSVIAVILIYFFLLKYTRNPYLTIFLLLFFPFIQIIFPPNYYMVLLTSLLLIYALNQKTVKSYFLYFCFLLFLLLWRMDIGSAVFPAAIITMVLFSFIHYRSRIKLDALKKSISYFIIFILVLTVLFYIVFRQKFVFSLIDAFSYFNSAQSYGFPDLAEKSNLFFYLIHYFAFPFIIVGLIIYATFILVKNKLYSERHLISVLLFIFLGLFYLLNFPRGLVRHALIENSDTSITSFSFFLIGGSIYFIKYSYSEMKKILLFIIISSLLILSFKFPREDVRITSLYSQFMNKIDSLPVIKEANYKIKRVEEDSIYAKQNCTDIIKFLKANLQHNETFIDFTNSPMLYYYSRKENPVFFNQPLLCSHNEYLQKRFIGQINKVDAPFVLFSKYPESSDDIVDGIPNSLRHFLIAEYIYQHYKPFALINNFCVWKNTNFKRLDSISISKIDNDSIISNRIKISPDVYSTRKQCFPELKFLPFIWGQYDSRITDLKPKKIITLTTKNIELKAGYDEKLFFNPISDKKNGNYLIITALCKTNKIPELTITFGRNDEKNGSFTFFIKNDQKSNKYVLRISTQYNWVVVDNNWVSLSSTDDVNVESVYLTEAD